MDLQDSQDNRHSDLSSSSCPSMFSQFDRKVMFEMNMDLQDIQDDQRSDLLINFGNPKFEYKRFTQHKSTN